MSAVETPLPPTGDMIAAESRDGIRAGIVAAIRDLHGRTGSLSRVHRSHPDLYARARRAFGSWREAVGAAGLDYRGEIDRSLRRGLLLRDERRALWRALSRFLLEHPGADDAALEAARPDLARRVRRCWGGVAEALAWAEGGRGGAAFTRLLHGGNG